MSLSRRIGLVAVLAALVPPVSRAGGPYAGPYEYLSAADNYFPLATPGFCLETFEDGTLDPVGVTGNGTILTPGGLTDSVDGDDGSIDGSGNGGHSYYSGDGQTGITFTFDPQRAGGLPTQAGMTWTDGEGTTTFEAFDQNGASLGTLPRDHADGSASGTTGEDRFYAVSNAGGISAIKLTNTSGGIEVDHLTLNNTLQSCDNSAASTTTTTVTTTTTTTATTIPAGCSGVPVGATFESLNCRLAALIAAVQGESQLGKQQAKLDKDAM
jgi:hypothetical protein